MFRYFDIFLIPPFQVPRFDMFSDTTQLHAPYVIQLKSLHKCEKHPGEHGQDGHCYINPKGEHLGLNNKKIKEWSAAWVC